jgi:hypothetical protein
VSVSTEPIVVPARWPAGWSSLWPVLASRAVFVAMVGVLTAIALLIAGDPGGQWWLPFVPAVLLLGPAANIWFVRSRWQRAAARGRFGAVPGRMRPTGPRAVFEPDSGQQRDPVWLPARYAVGPALLLRHRRDVAVVLVGGTVRYVPRHWLRRHLP